MQALLVGVLSTDPATGCVYLAESAGVAGDDRVAVIWPSDVSVLEDPIRLQRENGELIATAGDRLRVTGGTPSAGSVAPSGCEGAALFLATEIEVVDD